MDTLREITAQKGVFERLCIGRVLRQLKLRHRCQCPIAPQRYALAVYCEAMRRGQAKYTFKEGIDPFKVAFQKAGNAPFIEAVRDALRP